MVEFDYTAKTAAGAETHGRVSARNEAAARESLEARGWTLVAISQVRDEEASPPARRLSRAQSDELTQVVSEVCSDDYRVIEGFRAAALETSHGRLAETFTLIADQLEAGRSLAAALQDQQLPMHLLGLVRTAARTGKMGFALTELLEGQRATRDLKRSVTLDLAYPIVVMCLAIFVFMCMGLYLVPMFHELFQEFGMSLPFSTRAVLWLSQFMVKGFIVVAPPLFALLVMFRVMAGDGLWGRLMQWIPIVGAIWKWSAVVEFSRTCGILLRYDLPLAEAMLLTSEAVDDWRMRRVGRQLAHAVDAGERLHDSIRSRSYVPASFIPFMRWGATSNSVGEAFESLADMFEERVRVRSALIRVLVPPLVFVFVLLVISWAILALFLPMFGLISLF